MMGSLVVVAVEQHEVPGRHQGRKHDFVGGGGAVQDEVGPVSAKNPRRGLLRRQRWTFMNEKVAQFYHGIIQVVTEHRLAQMFDENPADGALSIEDSAVVAGAGPDLVSLLRIVDHRSEEWGLERSCILLEVAHQVAGDEGRRILGQEDVASDLTQGIDGNLLKRVATNQNEDGNVEPAIAQEGDKGSDAAGLFPRPPFKQDAADRSIRSYCQLAALDALRFHHLEAEMFDLFGNLTQALAFERIGA